MAADADRFLAPLAWVGGAWARDVLLEVGADGCWRSVTPDAPAASRAGAQPLAGPVLPGLVDAHSHAFQRAIAGLTESSAHGEDDFWRWRDRMYSVANRITPQQLEAIAAYLYAELLDAGYTEVCEFQYLHNAIGGQPFAQPAEMALALARAAGRVGIGLTLLPTLYMRSGFGAAGLRPDQQRFASTPDSVMRIGEAVDALAQPLVHAGVALHSLRAVDRAALTEVAAAARGRMPVHIHIAEQQQEVAACVAQHGRCPVEWLLEHVELDAHWNLVHATQTSSGELAGVHSAGASIVICPATEANLGDGVFDLPDWLGRQGSWSIGSDSHVTRSWQEELRLLEYSQRLALRRRNIAARSGSRESSAAVLFDGALAGGSAAAGRPLGGLRAGERADFMVIDREAPALLGVPDAQLLDALVFSTPHAGLRQVHVAGRPVRTLADRPELASAMRAAMQALWR
ncbi:formimidoylglutamate deiminase [Caenimonas terrae]|uniref:Formimidoylglutamate deiminase n=1 Tax=Caenimonas terrae TaxID=696074 RepID=A0ABW0NJV8_9BURK